jgi:hypothetical protein
VIQKEEGRWEKRKNFEERTREGKNEGGKVMKEGMKGGGVEILPVVSTAHSL